MKYLLIKVRNYRQVQIKILLHKKMLIILVSLLRVVEVIQKRAAVEMKCLDPIQLSTEAVKSNLKIPLYMPIRILQQKAKMSNHSIQQLAIRRASYHNLQLL